MLLQQPLRQRIAQLAGPLLALLERLPPGEREFTVADYCNAYRALDNRPARERQIGLIGDIGAGVISVKVEEILN